MNKGELIKMKAHLNAVSKKLDDDLCFNTRRRNSIKRKVLELQRSLLLQNVDTTIKPVLKQEYKEREFYVSWTNICTKLLKIIKKAESFKYSTTLKNCHFKIYKAKKGRMVVIVDKFFKVCENKSKIAFIIFPNGFPEKSKKRCKILRPDSDLKLDPTDFIFIDKGRFKQKIEDFDSFSLTYKGKIFNNKLILKQIKESNIHYWARVV